jgi:hypothetical protein
MRCPKCGFTSFPYLESCRKCGQSLVEHRAVFGLYALRPDPPDLLAAYRTTQVNVDETEVTLPQPASDIDSGTFDGIDLDREEDGPATAPTFPHQGSQPRTFDPDDLEGITLELENATDLGSASLEATPPPTESSAARQVYDLDLDEDLDARVLSPKIDESGAQEHDEEVAEYTLEIDDEVELEFEINELDIEEDGAAEPEGEDDDDR